MVLILLLTAAIIPVASALDASLPSSSLLQGTKVENTGTDDREGSAFSDFKGERSEERGLGENMRSVCACVCVQAYILAHSCDFTRKLERERERERER